MRNCLKTISVITLTCFSLTNISFAQEINSFKLAPPSSFSSMKGPEFKEAAQIQVGILTALKDLQELDVDSIKALGQRQFVERSVFGRRIEGTIYFNEASECRIGGRQVQIEKGSYIFKATTNSDRTYYALLSEKQKGAGYEVSIVSEKALADALKKGAVKFTHSSVDEKDKGIVNLYLEHEITTENNIAIDEWIRERMERGEYAVDDNASKSPLYQHSNKNVYRHSHYTDLLAKITEYLVKLGVKKENIDRIAVRMFKNPLVLIPYEDETDLPTIAINGKKTRVYAHSSEFATYIFLPGSLYGSISKSTIWSDEIRERLERELIHEIGAICGLKVTVENSRAWNLLDEAVSALIAGKKTTPSQELQNLSPVNLLDLELRNDYAAGETEKKGIFNRIVTLMLAGLISVVSSCSTTTETGKEPWPWEGWTWGGGINDKTISVDSAIIEVFNESETCKKLRQAQTFSEYLGNNGNRKAIEFLLDAVENSKNGTVRLHAIFAMSKIVNSADKDIVDRLTALLKRKSPGVGWNLWESENFYVMDALGAIGDERAAAAILDYAHTSQLANLLKRAEEALVRIGPRTLPFVIDRLKSVHSECVGWEKTEWGSASRSLHYLEEMLSTRALPGIFKEVDGETIEPLIKAMNDKDDWMRNLAARLLLQDEAADVLLRALSSKDTSIRMSVERLIRAGNVKLLLGLEANNATELLEMILNESDSELERKIAQDAINAIKLTQLLGEYSYAGSIGYRSENTDPVRAKNAILEMGSFAEEKIIQIALYEEHPYPCRYGAQRMILAEFSNDDAIVRRLIDETLLRIKTEPGEVWLLKKLFRGVSDDRFVRLTQGLDEQSRLFLSLFYFTNQEPPAEGLGSDVLHSEYRIAGLYKNASDTFGSLMVRKFLAELDRLDTIEPEILSRFVMAIAAAGKYPPDWYAPAVPQYGRWAGLMLDDMRIVALAKNSTIVKLLAHIERRDNVFVTATCIEIPNSTWGDRYLMWPKHEFPPVEFGKEDIPVLQRLLSSKNEIYRKAAAEALRNLDNSQSRSNIKSGINTPEDRESMVSDAQPDNEKSREGNISTAKPAIPGHIKAQMDNIAGTIPSLDRMRAIASERADKITEILWKAGLGSISKTQAKEELARIIPEVGTKPEERNRIYDAWIATAGQAMIAMSIKLAVHNKPDDQAISQIAARIKEAGIEVFIPKSQFPGDTISRYRGIIEAFGGKLRVYQHVEDLQTMIKNPVKSMVMTVDVKGNDAELLKALKENAQGLRFMNFAKMEDLGSMSVDELDNYEAEILGILLIARIITPEDFQDKGSSAYRMLSHLLEDYMPDGVDIDEYIYDIVTSAARLIKTILKALPAAAYKVMRQSVEVLWAA